MNDGGIRIHDLVVIAQHPDRRQAQEAQCRRRRDDGGCPCKNINLNCPFDKCKRFWPKAYVENGMAD